MKFFSHSVSIESLSQIQFTILLNHRHKILPLSVNNPSIHHQFIDTIDVLNKAIENDWS